VQRKTVRKKAVWKKTVREKTVPGNGAGYLEEDQSCHECCLGIVTDGMYGPESRGRGHSAWRPAFYPMRPYALPRLLLRPQPLSLHTPSSPLCHTGRRSRALTAQALRTNKLRCRQQQLQPAQASTSEMHAAAKTLSEGTHSSGSIITGQHDSTDVLCRAEERAHLQEVRCFVTKIDQPQCHVAMPAHMVQHAP
jgi:hypothetical protein